MDRRIVLVEDNPTDEKLTRKAFEKCALPHLLEVVRDGAEALERFRSGPRPSLVLLDLRLPRVDGFDVLRGVRADARTRLVPVVVLSASKEEEDIRRCYDLGANGYVRKPLDFRRFVEVFQSVIAFWVSVNEPPPGPS